MVTCVLLQTYGKEPLYGTNAPFTFTIICPLFTEAGVLISLFDKCLAVTEVTVGCVIPTVPFSCLVVVSVVTVDVGLVVVVFVVGFVVVGLVVVGLDVVVVVLVDVDGGTVVIGGNGVKSAIIKVSTTCLLSGLV